jgi:hypothetical protein
VLISLSGQCSTLVAAVNVSNEGYAIALQDNWPELEVTCLELSPFYLAKARENMRYWCAVCHRFEQQKRR